MLLTATNVSRDVDVHHCHMRDEDVFDLPTVAAQASGKHEKSLKQAKRTLKTVENWSDEDVPNRADVVANLHSCIGNAYLELGKNNKALEHYERDFEIAKQK